MSSSPTDEQTPVVDNDVEMADRSEDGAPEASTSSPNQTVPEASERTSSDEAAADAEPAAPDAQRSADDTAEQSDDGEMDDAKDLRSRKDSEASEAQEAQPAPSVKSKSLREFLGMMDDYAPIIPDAVTDYYLNAAGFDCDDRRIKRLLALAAQKFISDIAQDAYQHSKIRASNSGGNVGAGGVPNAPRGKYGKERARVALTMDDLAASVNEYGINLKRPDFWR